MKKSLLILIGLFTLISLVCAQDSNSKILKPILLEKSALSGIGLKKVDLKDEPEKDFYQKNLYRGEELSVYVVSTETWNNKMDNFPFDEFIYMLHGEAIVKPTIGRSQIFYAGDYFFAPKGYTGEWEIRAGDNLHYELSVITTKRSEIKVASPNSTHQLLSKSKLSGAHIHFREKDTYRELLQDGRELTIYLEAEKPQEKVLAQPSPEKVIHLLSGMIIIHDMENNPHTFYSGDFFILPKGYIGKWKSEGHGIIKYLSIEETNE